MGRFKAGDRVKILAGHPYTAGRENTGEEMAGTVQHTGGKLKGRRGKFIVSVDGYFLELSFKGRELELLVDAPASQEPWMPKVGDRVRVVNPDCMRTGTPIGAEGVVTAAGGGEYFDIDLNHPTDGVINQLVSARNVQPLPVAEQPTGLTIEAGKFYRTRDGRKVGPMMETRPWTDMHGDTAAFSGLIGGRKDDYTASGLWLTRYGEDRPEDLVAEWVDEPQAEPATAAAPPAKFKAGDRVKVVAVGSKPSRYVGTEFVIDSNEGLYDGEQAWSGERNPYRWKESQLELVIAPTPSAPATPAESFIVARLTPSGQPRPNARPRVHATLDSADQEAARLANRLGDEFAVYQRVSSRTVDAGPVPNRPVENFKAALAGKLPVRGAFQWSTTKQGRSFWLLQDTNGLTPLGRAILRKWIAEAEANPKEAA